MVNDPVIGRIPYRIHRIQTSILSLQERAGLCITVYTYNRPTSSPVCQQTVMLPGSFLYPKSVFRLDIRYNKMLDIEVTTCLAGQQFSSYSVSRTFNQPAEGLDLWPHSSLAASTLNRASRVHGPNPPYYWTSWRRQGEPGLYLSLSTYLRYRRAEQACSDTLSWGAQACYATLWRCPSMGLALNNRNRSTARVVTPPSLTGTDDNGTTVPRSAHSKWCDAPPA